MRVTAKSQERKGFAKKPVLWYPSSYCSRGAIANSIKYSRGVGRKMLKKMWRANARM